MSTAPPRPGALERAVAPLLAATVFAFAAGSSSVRAFKDAGLEARWAALALLAVAAVAARRRGRLEAPVTAAAGALLVLTLVSSLWSVDPRSTAARAVTLLILFATAIFLTAGAGDERGERLLRGLLAGAAAVALAGAVVLAVSSATAVTGATLQSPARFRGFGEDPNTIPLLLALAAPIALHQALAPAPRAARRLGAAALLLFVATIVGSGSRGALLAAAVGVAVTAAFRLNGGRARGLAIAAVVAATALGAVLQSLPSVSAKPASPAAAAATGPTPRAGYTDVERAYPLDADVGRPLPGGGEPAVRRSYLGASGRGRAWLGALEEIGGRPVAGYGFGTERKVFEDRYYTFVGDLPENSYLGMALQLGAVGLAGLLGLVAVLVGRGRAALRAHAPVACACAGVVAAGLAVAVVQSYLYSVGNLAAATFWIPAFLLASAGLGKARA